MNKRVLIVFKKEMQNALRDRRTLYSTVLFPLLIMPAMVILPMTLMQHQRKKIKEMSSKIAIVDGENFTELANRLESNTKLSSIESEDAMSDLKSGRVDCVVKMEAEMERNEPASVLLFFDRTRRESEGAANKVKLVVAEFSNEKVSAKLQNLKIDPSILTPVILKEKNIATPKQMGGFFIGMLVGMMAVIGTISGGMILAIDATAGEKERRTLEVLLASPATRKELVLSKFLGTLTMAVFSVILMCISFTLSMTFSMNLFAQQDKFALAISGTTLPLIFFALILIAGFVGALEIAIAIFARSFREAQSYMTPFTIVAIIPVIFMQTISTSPPQWMFWVPLMNTMLLIRELLMGIVNSNHLTNTFLSSFIYAILSLKLSLYMFNKESVIMR